MPKLHLFGDINSKHQLQIYRGVAYLRKIQYPSRETQLHATMTVESSRKVYVDAACLTWKQLFTSWFNAIKTEPWLENHDVILQQLFQWLLPPLLSCISTCRCFPPLLLLLLLYSLLFRLAAPISSLNLVQGSLDLFQVLLQEALPNLKERKYLRGWIQVSR